MFFLIFILGLSVGSFLNVVICRLKEEKKFIKGRSYCPKCKHILRWYDNIPLISFIILEGKCRYCRKKISLQYPLVELGTGILFALAFLKWEMEVLSGLGYKPYLLLISYFIFISFLVIIFVYDLRWYLILDRVSAPAIITALILNLLLGYSFLNLILAAGIIGGVFLLQFLVSDGKWIGGGDIRLGFLMGVMLGLSRGIVAFFIAYFLGSIIGIILVAMKRKKMSSRIPFGTFLTVGVLISMFYGDAIARWYIGLLK